MRWKSYITASAELDRTLPLENALLCQPKARGVAVAMVAAPVAMLEIPHKGFPSLPLKVQERRTHIFSTTEISENYSFHPKYRSGVFSKYTHVHQVFQFTNLLSLFLILD